MFVNLKITVFHRNDSLLELLASQLDAIVLKAYFTGFVEGSRGFLKGFFAHSELAVDVIRVVGARARL